MIAGGTEVTLDVGFGSIATKMGCPGHVRFAPGSDRIADITERQFRAMNGIHRLYQDNDDATG